MYFKIIKSEDIGDLLMQSDFKDETLKDISNEDKDGIVSSPNEQYWKNFDETVSELLSECELNNYMFNTFFPFHIQKY